MMVVLYLLCVCLIGCGAVVLHMLTNRWRCFLSFCLCSVLFQVFSQVVVPLASEISLKKTAFHRGHFGNFCHYAYL